MIYSTGLRYSIKDHLILDDIDLTIEKGQYFALAGINGAGKSTFIKLVLDLLRTSNESMININGLSSWQVSSRDQLSYLPEKFQVNKAVTGLQYCRFIFGIHQQKLDLNTVHTLCEQLDFKIEALSNNVNTYSKGMMQKLGLISNFMLNKPLMILDEPLSGLDPKARYCLKQLLHNKKEEGLTLFYSTHMLADAEEVCDQFGVLDEGRLKFVGTPEQCKSEFKAETLEEAYMKCIS